MSTASVSDKIVPHMVMQGIKEDPLSKRLRKLDNSELVCRQMGAYIGTNELGVTTTLKVMATFPRVEQGCHIGFSGWHNFDLMVVRQSSRAVIADFNPENGYFLHHVLEIIRKSKSRTEFVEQAVEFIEKVDRTGVIGFVPNLSEDEMYAGCSSEDEVRVELKKDGSWLQSDQSYAYIRSLALSDKIAIITEDIRSVAVFQRMAKTLQENGVQIDSLYLSNISAYMREEQDREKFLETVNALSEGETIIITSCEKDSKWKSVHFELEQKVAQRKAIGNLRENFYKKT